MSANLLAGHDLGDPHCIACTSATVPGFPEPHECGGYLHWEDGTDDEGFDNGVLDLRCDKCGAFGTRVRAQRAGDERAHPRTTVPTVLDAADLPAARGKGTR